MTAVDGTARPITRPLTAQLRATGRPATIDRATLTDLAVRCMECGTITPGDQPISLCPACGGLLDAVIDVRPISPADLGQGLAPALARSGVWRYRPLLPAIPEAAIVSRGEGQHPALRRRSARDLRWPRCRAVRRQARGRQPDRLVQGPRHDGRHFARRRGRGQGRGLRQHGQHVGIPGQLRRGGRVARDGPRPGRQDLGGQAGPDDRLRRPGRPDRGRLRHRPPAPPRADRVVRRLPDQLGQSVPARGAEDDHVRAVRAARLGCPGRDHRPRAETSATRPRSARRSRKRSPLA